MRHDSVGYINVEVYLNFMREFIFIYGRDPDLSHLELLSYFKGKGFDYILIERNKEVAIFSLPVT